MQPGSAQFVSFGTPAGRGGGAPALPDIGQVGGGVRARSPGEGAGEALLAAALTIRQFLSHMAEVGTRLVQDTASATGFPPLYVQVRGL
jgi:hypothetical protein